MTTNKELAKALRATADYYDSIRECDDADFARKKADELDPPKMKWADGQWVKSARGIVYQWSAANTAWFLGGDYTELVDIVRDPKPLRVLGDDEVALSRDLFHGMTAKESRYKGSKFLDNSDCQRIFYAYADALDAEEGDAK